MTDRIPPSPVPVAAVFCAESYNALAVIRALGRRGIETVALGSEADSISFKSRYAAQCIVHPDPIDEAAFAEFVIGFSRQLAREERTAVAFPTSDRVIKLLSEHREVIDPALVLFLPPREVIDTCLDKLAQYRLCEQIGVPYPRTYTNGDEERVFADITAGRVRLPVMCKARSPLPDEVLNRRFRRALLKTEAELAEHLRGAAELGVKYVAQEFIPGGDDQLYTLGSTMDRGGRMLSAFTGRKLRQMPPGFGICRVGESVDVPRIIEDGARLLRAAGFFGISQVEFKFDARDGEYKLMEVNPRSWSWIGLPVELGFDLPCAMFAAATGAEPPPVPDERERALWISLSHDLEFSLAHRDALPWTSLFSGYSRVVGAYYAGDDPAPGIAHFSSTARDYAARLFRRIFGRLC